MKKIHLILCLLMGTTFLSAQCDELFISEYVEGGFNNKALEIYNPTNTAVDLSEYMIGRYRNGTLIFDGVQLPPIMLESYDVFVAVIDKRNPEGTCLEDPIWNGYVLLDTIEAPLGPEYNLIFSADTCADGETILASIAAGPTYYEEFDLEGKADGFFSPIYDENGAMYWNGNDAVVLIKGTEVNADFSNVIDVVGVIGEDPGGNGWRDSSFVNMSKDATITKNAFITHGSVQTADEGDAYLGDFNYWEWVAHPKYTFSNLGSHECICDENVAGVVSSIEVQVFYDFIANGVYDEGEEPLNNQSVSINPAALTGLTNGSGETTFFVSGGNYSVEYTPTGINPLWEVSGDQNEFLIDIDNTVASYETLSIPLTPIAEFTIQRVDLTSSITRCNQETNFWLTYENKGTLTTSGFVEFIPDTLGTFVSANPPADSTAGDTLYWFYENLFPTYSEQVQLVYQMPSVDFMGENLNYEAQIQTWEGLGDNKALLTSELVCAYDPNDKLSTPTGYWKDNYTLFEDTLDYTVRFQNTGNDTALSITVLDTLSEFLDLNTFEFIASSHSVRTQIKTDERIAEFYFQDIYLPDSFVNETASHGFVKFRILGNADLAENTKIENNAGIYFDFNPPIVTNTTINTMVSELPSFPVLSATPNSLEFGTTPIDELESLSPQILTIQNLGDLPLEINAFVFENEAFSTIIENITVGGQSTEEVEIYFNPSTIGEFTSQLVLESNDGSLNVELTGTSVAGTGVETLSKLLFDVYPNPNNGQFSIQSKITEPFNLFIQNSLGEIVWTQESNNGFVSVDLSKESKGIYFVSIQTEKGILVKKIVIQ